MLRKILFLMFAASLIVGFTSPASAQQASSADRGSYNDDYAKWSVYCSCAYKLKLEYTTDYGKEYVEHEEYCSPGYKIEEYIEKPDKYKKIDLEATLDYHKKYESYTKDAEKYYDGKFEVYHKNSNYYGCFFSSTVEDKRRY